MSSKDENKNAVIQEAVYWSNCTCASAAIKLSLNKLQVQMTKIFRECVDQKDIFWCSHRSCMPKTLQWSKTMPFGGNTWLHDWANVFVVCISQCLALKQVLKKKWVKLLAPTIRRPRTILNIKLHSIPELVILRTVEKRMAGRPRLSWTRGIMKPAWNINPHNPSFDLEKREMRLALQNMAQNRQYPFHWFCHLFFAAPAPTRFTRTYVLEARIFARSVLHRGPCLRGSWWRLVRQEKRFTQLLDVRYPQW